MSENAAAYTSLVEADLRAQTTSFDWRPKGTRAAYMNIRMKRRNMERT